MLENNTYSDNMPIKNSHPPRSKKLSMISTSLICNILLQMVAKVTSVSVDGLPSLAASSSVSLSKGGNAVLSSFPVA